MVIRRGQRNSNASALTPHAAGENVVTKRRIGQKQAPRPIIASLVGTAAAGAAKRRLRAPRPIIASLAGTAAAGAASRESRRVRFWFAGQRFTCDPEDRETFREELEEAAARTKTTRPSAKAWRAAVQLVKKGRGISHGGLRSCQKPAADPANSPRQPLARAGVAHQSPKTSPNARSEALWTSPSIAAAGASEIAAFLADHNSVARTGEPAPLNFKIQRQLGQGTYGIVYSAILSVPAGAASHDWPLPVAIKVVRKNVASVEAVVAQRREIAFLHSFRGHAHIVQLLAWRESSFDIQLFFPLYDGDLRTYYLVQQVPAETGKAFCEQLLYAVSCVHGAGIIHRDIKARNIFVSRSRLHLVLGDFGLASAVGDPHSSKPLTPEVVTLPYRAPEVMLTRGQYSFPIDVWALGVSLVEMECQGYPFAGQSERELLEQIFFIFGTPTKQPLAQFHGLAPWPNIPKTILQRIRHHTVFEPKPWQSWPWGKRYGPQFSEFTSFLLSLDPARRDLDGAYQHSWLDNVRARWSTSHEDVD